MKVLSPCGNLECLIAAICGGADEVYLGINDFNARNNIDGFTMDNFPEAVKLAHLFNVKVNLAINILFSDDELERAVKIVVIAYNMGVDSFIVQDLGLATVLSEHYPQVELHASTQMGIHNLEGVKAIEKFGFKRVVLARETPLYEVKRIRENTNIEIEYFAHGALCVSFSGNCYLSSYMLDASGNRGKCKQLCRLPYTLMKGEKKVKSGYLLSAKDFNTLNRLSDLSAAGVDVIKIEGRARRSYYVYQATKAYRDALGGKMVDERSVLLAFNRGFTEGYFNGNDNIISNIHNHVGLEIGKVYKVNGGKRFNEVFFNSNCELFPKSTFKFFSGDKESAVVCAYDLSEQQKGKYRLTTTAEISVGDSVNLIADSFEEEKVSNLNPKRTLDINLSVQVGKEILAKFNCNGEELIVSGETLQAAKSRPVTKEEIKDNFSKSNLFNCNLSFNKFEDAFIIKSALNEFRRKVLKKAEEEFTKISRKRLEYKCFKFDNNNKEFADFCTIENLTEIANAKEKNIIYSPEEYSIEDVNEFLRLCEKNNKQGCLDTPNFALKKDIEIIREIIEKTGVKIVANNYYAITLTDDYIVGGGLNVYNKVSAKTHGKSFICAEDSVGDKTDMPYMTLRHCPIKEHFGGSCADCKFEKDFKLISDSGKKMRIKRKKLSSCTFYLTD